MADYWKSQDRKYCDFCKCWLADNKPSIQFHESGKKHKENVTKRLNEISKQSVINAKKQKEDDDDFKKMEEDAMKAYMKDIARGGDYTTQQLKTDYELPPLPQEPAPSSNVQLPSNQATSSSSHKSDMVPEISIPEQSVKRKKKAYSEPIGPEIRTTKSAYGAWETVQEEEPFEELDLPKTEYVAINVPSLHPEYELKIKEKTFTKLKDDDEDDDRVKKEPGVPTFKKRKFNKGNSRQRLDDD